MCNTHDRPITRISITTNFKLAVTNALGVKFEKKNQALHFPKCRLKSTMRNCINSQIYCITYTIKLQKQRSISSSCFLRPSFQYRSHELFVKLDSLRVYLALIPHWEMCICVYFLHIRRTQDQANEKLQQSSFAIP